MPQTYTAPSRKVPVPVYIVERRIRTYWANRHPVPVSRIPLEQRTGMLHVTYVAGELVIRNNSQTDNVYPDRTSYEAAGTCAMYLEVLPRGQSEGRYAEWVERPPYIGTSDRVRRIQTRNTPIVASRQSWGYQGGSSVGTDAHLTLVPPGRIRHHLLGVLPYIGVHPSDVQTAYSYIDTLLNAGRRDLRVRR